MNKYTEAMEAKKHPADGTLDDVIELAKLAKEYNLSRPELGGLVRGLRVPVVSIDPRSKDVSGRWWDLDTIEKDGKKGVRKANGLLPFSQK